MKFTYIGEVERDYHDGAFRAVPGNSYELDADPGDGLWTPDAGGSVVGTAEASVSPPDSPVTTDETTGE